MDRRATLATIFGMNQSKVANTQSATMEMPAVNSGLDPYTGSWEYEQAAHLLRRSMFGPKYAQIKDSINQGLEATIDLLFAEAPIPEPPLNFTEAEDPFVPIGETWINAPYSADLNLRTYRNQSLRAWTVGRILEEGISIKEKMVLFWHNHFVTGEILDPKFNYRYISLFLENAIGNFRDLTKMITVNPSMLRYLNGSQNTAVAPNENYARELLELFTIGKGELAGPGDYTNYTETDVVQMARVLTGWRDIGFNTLNPDIEVSSTFVPNRHDSGTKTLSERFDNLEINNMGENEYSFLIDVIFQKDEVAKFIARKFYRWFIYYIITPEAEINVIEPMAQMIVDNNYDVEPALRALLSSEHFYDMLNVGPMIKNPIDFIFSILKQTEMAFPNDNLNQQYRHWWQVARTFIPLGMEYYNPPSVAGWKAYYQEPTFYRIWIDSVTFPIRMELIDGLVNNGINVAGAQTRMNVIGLAASLDDPFDPNSLIEEFAAIFFPQPITQFQKDYLKEVLIPGLPDFEWTVEYGEFINNPTPDLEIAVDNKLRTMIHSMFNMPEFQLS